MNDNATTEDYIAAAGALTSWCRGDIAETESDSASVIVVARPDDVDWLLTKGRALVGPSTAVIVTRLGAGPALPEAWIAGAGTVSEVGGELRLGDDFFLQSVDYASLRYMTVIGPTVVRLTGPDDVADLFADIALAHTTGSLPPVLCNPLIEFGDHCAFGFPCSGRHLVRLHLDQTGEIRTSPFGVPLGSVTDDVQTLRERARLLETDPCVPADVAAELAVRELAPARLFLAALEALRTLALSAEEDWRTTPEWRVSGIGFQLAEDGGPMPEGSGLLVLVSGEHHVLFETATRRTFRTTRFVALVVELLLSERDERAAAARLSGVVGSEPEAVAAVQRVRQSVVGLRIPLDV